MNSGSTIHCPGVAHQTRYRAGEEGCIFLGGETQRWRVPQNGQLAAFMAGQLGRSPARRASGAGGRSRPSSRLPPLALSSGRASRTSTLSCITSDTSRTGGKISASSVSISAPSAKRTISRVALSRKG